MPTVEELVVRAKPENLDSTVSGLEDMEEQFDETANSMGETTQQFEDMSSKWQGLMGTLVAGLSVATAGILANVPVLGEAMSGLASVAGALGFQMDQVLRPALTPLTNLFYDISAAVYELDGAWGTIVGVAATLAAALTGVVAATLAIGAAIPGLTMAGALGTLASAFTTVGGIVAGFISTLAGLISLPALIIGAIVAFAAAYATNFMGIRDKTNKFVGQIIKAIASIPGKAVKFFKGLFDGAAKWIGKLVDKAATWGQNILDNLIKHMKGFGRMLARPVINGLNALIGAINKVIGSLPKEVGIEKLNTVSMGDIGLGRSGGGGGGGGGGGTSSNGFAAVRAKKNAIYLDGRRVDEQTGRYRDDETSRRGRFG